MLEGIKFMKIAKLNKQGDTIIEVLIAMVILAFVLTGAYESAQYSLDSIINSENRVTALNIASGQIESLKELLASNPASIKVNSGSFYLDSNNHYQSASSFQTRGIFMYEFKSPVANPSGYDYTFTVNVYWKSLNINPVNHACNAQNILNCDDLNISYQAATT